MRYPTFLDRLFPVLFLISKDSVKRSVKAVVALAVRTRLWLIFMHDYAWTRHGKATAVGRGRQLR